MTLYFAYGANLDHVGMAHRCPGAAMLGPARLEDHRFMIMEAGYATVLPSPDTVVHGLLWTVTAADLAALDDFEDLDAGLYHRSVLPIRQDEAVCWATVYVAANTAVGVPCPGYMEGVVAAALACGLPAAYRAQLGAWLKAPGGTPLRAATTDRP